jgi:FMN phosphatase YigB (HAD superfamily)
VGDLVLAAGTIGVVASQWRGTKAPGKLVLFDLDNTLADRAGAFARWAARFATHHGIDDDGVSWLIEEDQDGFRSRQDFLAAARLHFGISEGTAGLVGRYREDYALCYVTETDSIAAVSALRRAGLKVGVVTNGEPSQEVKLRVTGLTGEVDAVCVSSLVGSRKPELAIFAEAARRCAVPLTGWMVGDAPIADIQGGQRAGLITIWLHRGRRWDRAEVRPDFVVETVTEAAETILAHVAC